MSLSTGTKNKSEAEKIRTRFIADRDKGVLATSGNTTVSEFAEKWLERQPHLTANTVRTYRQELGYAMKIIGSKKLSAVKPATIKDMFAVLAQQPVKVGTKLEGRDRKSVV